MGFRTYLWDRRRSWLLALGLLAVLLVVLLLFRLPVLAVGYGALLCGVIYLGAGIWDFVQWSRRHHRLQNLEQEVLSTLDNLPPAWVQPGGGLSAPPGQSLPGQGRPVGGVLQPVPEHDRLLHPLGPPDQDPPSPPWT